jgi:hypothetical protein
MITPVHASIANHTGHSDAARPAGMEAAVRIPGTPFLHGVSCSIATVPTRDPTHP